MKYSRQRILLSVFYCLSALLFLFSTECYGAALKKKDIGKEKDKEPPKLGNFALPSSQQPGAFFAFGQNIFDKGTLQANIWGDYFKGGGFYSKDLNPGLLYCPSDTSSLFLSLPYAAQFRCGEFRSRGSEDSIAQFEYAFYTKSNVCYSDQATIVMNVSFPQGKASKNPPTGYGASSYFLGFTFLRTYVDWLLFTSHGVVVTDSHHGTKFGNEFLYQFGIGKNVAYLKDRFILDWVLELAGQYTGKSKIASQLNPNSGGNLVLLIPSLWLSTKQTILQLGIGKPVIQHMFGCQGKTHYVLLANFTWTF
jgi:hypothetical protein